MSTNTSRIEPANGNDYWLNQRRLRAYPVIFLGVYMVISICWILLSTNMIDIKGTPLGADFITFWAASHLGLHGNPVDAYDALKIHAAEELVVPSSGVFVWLYPPTFFALVLPLAKLPYIASYLAFMLTSLSGFLATMWKISPTRQSILLVLAFPGVLINFMSGQNAFLTATLAGLSLLLLQKSPVRAGICIGLLAVKPHLAILFPLALIISASWQAMLSAAITSGLFIILSTFLLGTQVWDAFLNAITFARQLNEQGALPWEKMSTVFAGARALELSLTAAYALHASIALLATMGMITVWRRTIDLHLRGASFVAATLLISPHLFVYDMLWLALPIAWLTLHGMAHGWRKGDRELLILAWLYPLISLGMTKSVGLQIGPLISFGLLLMTLRHSRVG